MNHKVNDTSAVESFLIVDAWEARNRAWPYNKPDRRPSRIIWFLLGAASTLIAVAIAI